MRDLIVTNVEDNIVAALEKRAHAEGCPLDDWLRRKLQREAAKADPLLAPRPTPDEVRRRVEAAERIRALTAPGPHEDSTLLIRADRDRR
jgi:hypothetical protein